MKKLTALLIILTLVLSCAACKNNDPQEPENIYMNIPLKVGDYEISSVEAGYFFVDVINQWYNQYSSYASYYGLDTTVALNKQIADSKTNDTWAQVFLDMTIENIQDTYAMYNAAKAAGYTLTDEEQADLDSLYENFGSYASDAGFSTVDAYLQSMYGEGASESTYKTYFEVTLLAQSYYSHYSSTLLDSYTPEDLRAHEGDNTYGYDNYHFSSYYLDADSFESQKALYDAATSIAAAENNTVEKLNAAIAAVTKGLTDVSTTCMESKYTRYNEIDADLQEWLRDESRVPGDITAIAITTNSTITADGYEIVLFQGRSDNNIPLVNARHILIPFEGGTTNSQTGATEFSEQEKAAAWAEAEQLLEQWKQGEATGESFGALADQHSADTATGGLYQNIYPGEMFEQFNNWCFAEGRSIGDTAIIESESGCHIAYFDSLSTWNYRDYMVSNDKLTKELTEWEESIGEGMDVQKLDTVRIDMSQTVEDILY